MSVREIVKATRVPSGDTAGLPTRPIFHISSGVSTPAVTSSLGSEYSLALGRLPMLPHDDSVAMISVR